MSRAPGLQPPVSRWRWLLPDSLRARTLWLVLLLVVLSEGLTFLMLFQLRDDTVRRMAESLVRANVSLVREALRSSTPEVVSEHLRGAGMVRLVRTREVEGTEPLFRRPGFGPRGPGGGPGSPGGPRPPPGFGVGSGPEGEGGAAAAARPVQPTPWAGPGAVPPGLGEPAGEGRGGGGAGIREGRPPPPPPGTMAPMDPPWGRPPWSDVARNMPAPPPVDAPLADGTVVAPAAGSSSAGQRSDPPLPPPVRRWLMGLEREFGAGSVRILPPPRATVSIRVLDDWWMVIPFHRFEPAPPLGWGYALAWALAALLGAGLVALFAAHVARPLAALARAADDFADGRKPVDLTPSGPREVRGLTERFNAMVERITAADDERRVLLAGLPHDLRAPLTRLKLRLALLDDEARAGCERDVRDIERIAAQFVDYLRGVDLRAIDAQPVDIAALVSERVAAQREVGRDVQLVLDGADASHAEPLLCRGDARLVARIVDNLLENAFAHGAPPVTVRLRELAPGASAGDSLPAPPAPPADPVRLAGGAAPAAGSPALPTAWICLEVTDCGPGIAPERRAEALKPFTRLDAARSAGGHSGLGLALVERLVALHGGALHLTDRKPQPGLRVQVCLPRA